ncbi:hypothetical protein PRRU23_23820 [Segatella bryantii]|uniref:Uncharacterized protein n=1 Tax=Segatella bryantii TaxID=77095 RepID=A0AA37HZ76_SEGBR|nr:hypothetical protein PRRU23_23820 [Segatella bryantii]
MNNQTENLYFATKTGDQNKIDIIFIRIKNTESYEEINDDNACSHDDCCSISTAGKD